MNLMTAEPPKKRNERTCAGCNKHADRDELVRVILDPSSGEIAVDLAHTEFGHGGHVHPSLDCVAKAAKSGFSRVFKTKVVADASAIGTDIVKAADRRIEGLLTGARRAGQLSAGSDEVVTELKQENAKLVVVACDAAAATKLPEIERAIASGRAIAWSTKEHLAQLMARQGEVAVIAVLHSGVAEALQDAFRTSGSFRTGAAAPEEKSEEAWSSSRVVTSEVR